MLAESRRKLIPYAIAFLLAPLGAQDPTPPAPGPEPELDQEAAPTPRAEAPRPDLLPQIEERVTGSLAPAATSLWIRLAGAPEVLAGDRDRRIVQALTELQRRNASLAGRLRDVAFELGTFAAAQGFGEDRLADLLAGEIEISLFETGGRTDFLVAIPQGGRTADLKQIFEQHWKPWKPDNEESSGLGTPSTWTAVNPLPYGDKLYAGIDGVLLLLASSPDALALGRSLAAEQGAALAFDEDFRKVFGEPTTSSERSEWLSVFIRPRPAAGLLHWEQDPGFLRLIDGHAAVGFSSTFEDGRFHEALHLGREIDTGTIEKLFGAGGIEADFLARTRAALPESLRMRISVPGLLSTWREQPDMTGVWKGLGSFESRLANLGQGKTLDEVLGLWSGDLAVLGDGPIGTPAAGAADRPVIEQTPNPAAEPVLVFGLGDSFQARALFERLGKVQAAEGETGFEYFDVDWEDQVWHLSFDDHRLYASPSLQRMTAARLAIQIATPAGAAAEPQPPFLEGRLSVQAWLQAQDEKGALGLRPLATWFEDLDLTASRGEDQLSIELSAETGSFPWTLVSLDQVLGRLSARQADRNRDWARATCEQIQRAGHTYMQLVQMDEDHDGKGEAGSLSDLIDARRLQDGRQFRPYGHEVWERNGYRYRILLPLDVNQREHRFAVLAWPARSQAGKVTCFVLDDEGRLFAHELLADLDLEVGPGEAQVFAGEPFASPMAAGWEKRERRSDRPQATGAPQELPVQELETREALTLLESAWETKQQDRLRSFLVHPNTQIQARAAHYLGNLKDRESVPILAGLLKSSQDVELRRSAARALSLIRDPRGMASLVEALGDDDGHVRLFAATGFIGNPTPGSFDALLALVDGATGDECGDRSQAVLAIHDLDDPRHLFELVTVKAGALRFQQALVYCFQELSPRLQNDEPRLLSMALRNENKLLRKYAIQRIGEAQYTSALPALKDRLAVEDQELQGVLQNTVTALSPPSGLQSIKDNLVSLWHNGKDAAIAGWKRFRSLPQDQQYIGYGIVGGSLFLLLIVMAWRRRRRKAKARDRVLAMVASSGEQDYGSEDQAAAYADDAAGPYDQEWDEEGQPVGAEDEVRY